MLLLLLLLMMCSVAKLQGKLLLSTESSLLYSTDPMLCLCERALETVRHHPDPRRHARACLVFLHVERSYSYQAQAGLIWGVWFGLVAGVAHRIVSTTAMPH
jgi:hypothetical protein